MLCAGGEVSYGEHVAPLRAAGPASMRCVLVSATLPQHTFDELQELFPGLAAAFGPGLHRTSSGRARERVHCMNGRRMPQCAHIATCCTCTEPRSRRLHPHQRRCLQTPCRPACTPPPGLVEELVDCSGGDEVSLESGTARKLDAMMEAIGRVK